MVHFIYSEHPHLEDRPQNPYRRAFVTKNSIVRPQRIQENPAFDDPPDVYVVYADLAPLSKERYGWLLLDFWQWCKEHAVNPKKPKVGQLTQYLLDRPQWSVSRKTVALAALRRWFVFCGLPESGSENPACAPSLRKTGRAGRAFSSKRLPVSLTESEYQRVLEKTDPNRPEARSGFSVLRRYMLIRLLLWTGLRVSEAIHLRIDDLHKDEDPPFLRVIGKGDKEREIPLPDRLLMELEDYLEQRQDYLLRNGRSSVPYLFVDRNGAPYTPGGVWAMIDRLLREIDAQKRHRGPHILRHTFATRQLQAGIPPAVVKAWMGHGDLGVLFSVYEHVVGNPGGVRPLA